MNKVQRNRVEMFKTTAQWCENHLEALKGLPKFEATLTQIKDGLQTIDDLDASIDASHGRTEAKAAAREDLERALDDVVKCLKLYATFSDDIELLNAVDMSTSQISKLGGLKLLSRSQNLLDKAKAHQTDAAAYGLGDGKVQALEDTRSAFETLENGPRRAVSVNKDAHARLEVTIDDVSALITDKMDLIVDLVEHDQPDLYNQYEAVRVIVDR